MAHGQAAREVFGEQVVRKFASAAASDVMHHIGANDFLSAAFSAGHYMRLTGEAAWTSDEHERMSGELKDEVRLGLSAGHDFNAAARAASHEMLTGESPWSEEEMERLRKALSDIPGERNAYDSAALADRIADYLVLGGPVFWSLDEFHDLRKAIIVDFEHSVENGDDVLAADRLAAFDVIEAGLETLART